MHEIGYNLTI